MHATPLCITHITGWGPGEESCMNLWKFTWYDSYNSSVYWSHNVEVALIFSLSSREYKERLGVWETRKCQVFLLIMWFHLIKTNGTFSIPSYVSWIVVDYILMRTCSLNSIVKCMHAYHWSTRQLVERNKKKGYQIFQRYWRFWLISSRLLATKLILDKQVSYFYLSAPLACLNCFHSLKNKKLSLSWC